MNAYEIPIGSRLIVEQPPVTHHGFYLGNGKVGHNSKKNMRVCIETMSEFSGGRKIRAIPPKQSVDREALISAINKHAGRKYSLMSFNCEHFANEAILGQSISRQVTFAVVGAGVGFAFASTKELGLGKSLILMGLLGLGGLVLANASEA